MNNLHDIKGSVRLSAIIGQTLKIKPVKQDEYLGLCPFHNEKTPSFRVYDSTGKYWCFGCQAEGDVFDWLLDQRGMDMGEAKRYLGGDNVQMNVAPIAKKEVVPIVQVPTDDDSDTYYGADKDGVIGLHKLFSHGHSMVHYYRNEDGQILNKFARYEVTPFRPKKIFLPATHTKDGWINKAPTEKRTIYGLQKLKHLSGVRIVVSGEKKCDQLQEKLTDNATLSWSGGDSVFDKHDWLPIKDDVIIYWPDNDSTSIEIQHKLAKVCRKLYVIPIPEGMPKGWDCGNAIDAGWGVDDITAMIGTKVLYESLVEIEGPVVIPADVEFEETTPDEESPQKKSTKIPPKKSVYGFSLPAKELHNLAGELSRCIYDTASQKQPFYAIQAALSFLGGMLSHRVCTEYDGMTNIYCISVGEPGSGKDHGRQIIEIINEIIKDTSGSNLIMGIPASGTGSITSLKRRKGRALIQVDEMGKFLKNIKNKNAATFQKEIIDGWMMLYSCASSVFREKEYAGQTEDSAEIVKPCLSIHAMSTPDNFFDNMSEEDAKDGFLSRLMIITSEDRKPIRVNPDYNKKDIPEHIIKKLLAIEAMSTNWDDECSDVPPNKRIPSDKIIPKIIKFSPEAREILDQYEKKIDQIGEELFRKNHPLRGVWVRVGENCAKIALIIAEGDCITAEDMLWACQWVTYWTEQTFMQVEERTCENDSESNNKRVLQYIREAGKKGITVSELTKKTKWLRDCTHRKNILATLISAEEIEPITTEAKQRCPATTRYFIL